MDKNNDYPYLNGHGSLRNSISVTDEVMVALKSIAETTGLPIEKVKPNLLIVNMINDFLEDSKDSKAKSHVLESLNKFHLNSL